MQSDEGVARCHRKLVQTEDQTHHRSGCDPGGMKPANHQSGHRDRCETDVHGQMSGPRRPLHVGRGVFRKRGWPGPPHVDEPNSKKKKEQCRKDDFELQERRVSQLSDIGQLLGNRIGKDADESSVKDLGKQAVRANRAGFCGWRVGGQSVVISVGVSAH